jgi:hypothetical protein
MAALAQYALDVLGDDLGAYGARRDLVDLGEDLVVAAADRGEERGVGGHAVEHASAGSSADLVDLGGIQEDLHPRSHPLVGSRRRGGEPV